MFYMHVSHECTCMHAPTYLWVYVRMEWKKGGPINIAKTLLRTQFAELCVGLQMPTANHGFKIEGAMIGKVTVHSAE